MHAPVLAVRAAGIDRTRRSGEGDVVPLDLSLGGARRWVIAVDRACVRRVAVTAGTIGTEGSTPPTASDPLWRLTVRGKDGRGTGTTRYGLFGYLLHPGP